MKPVISEIPQQERTPPWWRTHPRSATPLIAHKSGNRPSQESKVGKLVAPPFAVEADGREPAAGIRGLTLP
jgi:hypothetical protein